MDWTIFAIFAVTLIVAAGGMGLVAQGLTNNEYAECIKAKNVALVIAGIAVFLIACALGMFLIKM